MLQFLLFGCCCITICLTHNIDTKVGPILKTHTAASYFGFSATGVIPDDQSSPWVAVGSPRANTSELNKRDRSYDTDSTGALYKCPVKMDRSDCTDITMKFSSTDLEGYDASNGWYGVSVVGGRQQDPKVMACSHKPVFTYCGSVQTSNCKTSMPGVCAILNKENTDHHKDITTIYENNLKDFSGDSGQITMSYKRFRFGETGIGATVGLDKVFYASAVGNFASRGSIVTDDVAALYKASDQAYSYGGYSLASGSFFKAGMSEFAIGAPRYNVTGAVFLHDSLAKSQPSLETLPFKNYHAKITIPGKQYGSYFGMAICAGDFDGDGISEIVVGAPYYTETLSSPSIGKVYVYSNQDNFASPVRSYNAPEPQARALFGKAVAVAGDMDLNGYNDLVVGAPYEGAGGVLYIYYGSSRGLSEKPVQIITASDFPSFNLKTFGWSVRGETDLDANGYPDVVVGAYASDSMVILRTKPVVEVDIEYKLSSPTIDVSNKSCSINDPELGKIQTVCFQVEVDASYKDRAGKMKNQIAMSFILDADTLVKNKDKKRVRFASSRSPHLEITKQPVKQGVKTPVVKALAYLRVDQCPDCDDKITPYPDIQLKVEPVLPEAPKAPPPPVSGDPPSLQPYFTLPFTHEQAGEKNFTDTTIKVKRACSPCKPNLKIENVGTTKIPVQATDVLIQVKISNTADQAFQVSLRIDFPPPLRVRPCADGIECLYFKDCKVQKNETQMICDLGNFARKAKEYSINVDTSEASRVLGTYDISMNVSSDNAEDAALKFDNSLVLPLKVASEADIAIQKASSTAGTYYGGSVRGQFAMTSVDEIGLKVIHKYLVLNKGPDRVPEVNITIIWPSLAKSGKHLLYLVNITGNDQVKCFPKPGWVNPLAEQFKERSPSRRRREIDYNSNEEAEAAPAVTKEPSRKGSSSGVVLDCANGTAICVSIPCTVSDIKRNEKVDIEIESRIWNGTLLEDYTDRDVRVISRARIDELTSYIEDKNTDNHVAQAYTDFFPASPKTTKKDLEVWIIVVSAIAGVVLLIILVVVFKMCGFFNRQETAKYDAVPEN